MRLQEWEVTIQKIINECNQEQARVDTVLMAWRAKLEKEPTFLQPFKSTKSCARSNKGLATPIDDTKKQGSPCPAVLRRFDVDQDQIEQIVWWTGKPLENVALSDDQPSLAAEFRCKWDQSFVEPIDNLGEQFHHLNLRDAVRKERFARRIAQPQSTDQHPKVFAGMHLECRSSQGSLRISIEAAHQKLMIQCHLRDDRARSRQQFTPPQTQHTIGWIGYNQLAAGDGACQRENLPRRREGSTRESAIISI